MGGYSRLEGPSTDRAYPNMIEEVRFAPDSALEGTGFEPSVPGRERVVVVGENPTPIPTKSGIPRFNVRQIFEFGSGSGKAEHGALIVPSERQTRSFSAVRSRGCRPSRIAWVISGAR